MLRSEVVCSVAEDSDIHVVLLCQWVNSSDILREYIAFGPFGTIYPLTSVTSQTTRIFRMLYTSVSLLLNTFASLWFAY
jgi:hypothetical protein